MIWVPFKVLIHYSDVDCYQRLSEDVNWIIKKLFREKFMVKMAFTLSGTFLTTSWVLSAFVVVFMIIRPIVMSY